MDSRARNTGWRTQDPLLLVALILILMAATLGVANAAELAGAVALGAAAVLAAAILRLHRAARVQQAQLRELEKALISQRVTDPATGATLPQWFHQALDTECRRAVREFTPLTLMQFDLQCDDTAALERARVRLASMLNDQISRPGDLVGLTDQGELQLLLPCTNEHAERLAQRCIEQGAHLFDDSVAVRLAACTLQPKADLCPDKVREQLLRVLDEVRSDEPGSYRFHAESTEADLFNPSFTQ